MSPEIQSIPRIKPYKLNIDDVPWQAYGRGRFASEHRFMDLHVRQRKIGLIVSRLAPGMASCPFHFHHVSEELFYILEGTGTLRYGADTAPLRPGDIVSCPPGPEGAHQLVCDGSSHLVYLAYSTEDHETEVCEYPDSDKVAIVAREPDGRPTFRGVYRRGDRRAGAPGKAPTGPYKVNVEDLAWQTFGDPGMDDRIPGVRCKRLDLAITRLSPGGTPNDFHFHNASEEQYFILEGTGTLRYGAETVPLRPGDVISCPPGPDSAHQILCDGPAPLVYLALSTEDHEAEVCEYPDSGLIRAWVPRPGGGYGENLYSGAHRKEDTVDYYDGELE